MRPWLDRSVTFYNGAVLHLTFKQPLLRLTWICISFLSGMPLSSFFVVWCVLFVIEFNDKKYTPNYEKAVKKKGFGSAATITKNMIEQFAELLSFSSR